MPSFYQVNRDQAEVLYNKAVEYAALTGKETVLDLYCGAGTITLCMARHAKSAIGAEIVPEAIEDVKENAARNGVRDRVTFMQSDVLKPLPIEEGSFFIADLIGLPVKHADTNAILGKLSDVNTSGARDLYVVKNQKGEFYIPAVPEFITKIDPDDAIYVRPIPGLIEGGED